MSVDAINWHTFFFLLFALFACGFAVAVVLSSNIVRMALCLIVSLGATAGLFFLAGADFVGAMQLMIYVGGTLVLLVFGVMLTAQGPFVSMKTGGGDWIVAVLLSGWLAALLVPAAFSVSDWRTLRLTAEAQHAAGNRMATSAVCVERSSRATTVPAAMIGPCGDGMPVRHQADADRAGLLGTRRQAGSPRLKRHVGLLAAVRIGVGPSAGRAGRRGLPGPHQASRGREASQDRRRSRLT